MNATYIVHPGTGTVISADECVIVNVPDEVLTATSGDDYFDDDDICEYAEEHGKPINTTDLTWSNCVAYSPFAIREEIRESLLEDYSDDEKALAVLAWASTATDKELTQVADYIVNSDAVWLDYRDNLMDGLREGFRWAKEKK